MHVSHGSEVPFVPLTFTERERSSAFFFEEETFDLWVPQGVSFFSSVSVPFKLAG